jgi:hypothetical protein
MLQASEIQQRFSAIQQVIGDAERAVDAASTSHELRECIHKMADAARSAKDVMQGTEQARMVEFIDRLEDMGDEAKRISRSDDNISASLETAVTRVHAELSKLKHQLH